MPVWIPKRPGLVLAMLIAVAGPGAALASDWAPVASERLMRLPGESLEKAVEKDFARSALAQDLADVDEQVAFKQMTLGDLKGAVERAEDSAARADLQFQFIEAKRDYLTLMREQQSLRKKRSAAKVRLYEKIFARLGADARRMTPERSALIDSQKSARQRMERSLQAVDASLLAPMAVESSRYATEYRKNIGAIESLMAAVQNHPMNRAPSIDGQPVTQEEYLRNLIANAQGELALAEQEEVILGHMAKLVSLDALALAEGIEETQSAETFSAGPEPRKQVSELVDLFITQ